MRALVLAVFAIANAGCVVDPTVNPGTRCDSDVQCPDGSSCYRGFCVGGGQDCDVEGAIEPCSERGLVGLASAGACRPGERRCVGGAWTECTGEVLPEGLDVCDGRDEDCDGTTDEDLPPSCDTGELGACGLGVPACPNGSVVCARIDDRTVETCDGTDQDCDGTTDEGLTESCYPAADGGCSDDDGDGVFECTGRCRAGEVRCLEGSSSECLDAIARAPDELCGTTPAQDDDCDGEVDEGCPCDPGSTQPCYGGSPGTAGIGSCRMGTQTCSGGSWGACEGQVVDRPETCADLGTDDDCDGTVDDVPQLGMSCTGTLPGTCSLGSKQCVGDELTCVTPEPRSSELCDGRDDDCDSMIDEAFDTTNDPDNCGSCGNACVAGQSCCDGDCVDFDSDPDNCGACGVACGSGQACCDGVCADTSTSTDHCGACGSLCTETCCDGVCVDTDASPEHCGACATTCASGDECCGGSCASPTAPACTGCALDCSITGETCCGASCVDLAVDEANCGACGVTCTGSDVCCNGACVPSDETHCGQGCGACGSGELCCDGSCEGPGPQHCNACNSACAPPSTCCTDGCFDLRTSDTHCGDCGVDCTAAGAVCSDGHCCPPGQSWCDEASSCVNLQSDNEHCGSCGNGCSLLTSCQSGVCRL